MPDPRPLEDVLREIREKMKGFEKTLAHAKLRDADGISDDHIVYDQNPEYAGPDGETILFTISDDDEWRVDFARLMLLLINHAQRLIEEVERGEKMRKLAQEVVDAHVNNVREVCQPDHDDPFEMLRWTSLRALAAFIPPTPPPQGADS